MKEPLVSIVIPAYCHEKYIESCLESVCMQTYRNIEVIIFDDNSSDNTFEIVQHYKEKLEKRFDRVVCHKNPQNMGVVKNENEMIKLCRGKYIKSIASDDMLMKNAIEDLVEYFEAHTEYDIIFSNALYCDETEKYPLNEEKKYKYVYEKKPYLQMNIMQQLYEYNFIAAPTVLFKKDTFEKYGLYDEEFTIEDWEYWLRISESGKVGYCDTVTVAYRIVGQSLSHFTNNDAGRRRLKNMYNNQLKILDKYKYSTKISAEKGYENLFNRFVHEAIDINYTEFLEELLYEVKNKKIKLNLETQVKYIAYKFHFLRTIQKIKRKLGLETVEDYKAK